MTSPTATWRVQWYSRSGIGEPCRPQGRRDFDGPDAETDARAYYDSADVQSLTGPYWRVELQRRAPWECVDRTDYQPTED